MAFQKTALLASFLKATQPARTYLGVVMLPVAAALAIGIAAPTHSLAATNDEPSSLYEMGDQVCQQILDAGADNILGDIDYSASVDDVGIDRSVFCGCVGAAFVFRAEEQSSLMEGADSDTATAEIFVEALMGNLDICLNPDVFFYNAALFNGTAIDDDDAEGLSAQTDADGCEDGCQDGPIWAEAWDKVQCEYAISDSAEPAALDHAFVQEWIEDSGVDAESLCSCAALVMDDRADEYATEYAASQNPELYWDYMALAIDQCQMAIWQRPLL